MPRMRPANVPALTCGRNDTGSDHAAGRKCEWRARSEPAARGHQEAQAPVRFSGMLSGAPLGVARGFVAAGALGGMNLWRCRIRQLSNPD